MGCGFILQSFQFGIMFDTPGVQLRQAGRQLFLRFSAGPVLFTGGDFRDWLGNRRESSKQYSKWHVQFL